MAQLQLRRYRAGQRSPSGLDEPMYWMDFDDHAPPLPEQTIAVFCYHVGQTDDSDARDQQYWGRGLGVQLLDVLLGWATGQGYAIVAKGVPTAAAGDDLPRRATELGVRVPRLHDGRHVGRPRAAAPWSERDHLAPSGEGATLDDHARVACCVRWSE